MAEFLLTIHFLFILFMVAGFPIGLISNNRRFRYIHGGLLAFVTLLMISGIPCPLTIWEEQFRGESYQGSFLAVWLNKIIYLTWLEPRAVFIMDMVFALLVFSSFFWYPVNKAGKGEKIK